MKVAIVGTEFETDISKIHRHIEHYLHGMEVDKIVLFSLGRGVDRIAMLYALKKHIPFKCVGMVDIERVWMEANILLAFPSGDDEYTRSWIKYFEYWGKKVIKHELLKQYTERIEDMNIYMMYHYNGCRTGFRIMAKYWKDGYAVVTRVGCAKEGKRINWQDPNLPDKSVTVDYYNKGDEKTGSGILRNPESMDYYLLETRTV